MHVQPYKHNVNEKEAKFLSPLNLLNIPSFVLNKNGVTVTVFNGEIKVFGDSNSQTTFLIPIDVLRLNSDIYRLLACVLGLR